VFVLSSFHRISLSPIDRLYFSSDIIKSDQGLGGQMVWGWGGEKHDVVEYCYAFHQSRDGVGCAVTNGTRLGGAAVVNEHISNDISNV